MAIGSGSTRAAGDVDLRLRQRGLQAEDDGEHHRKCENGAPGAVSGVA